MPSHNSVAKRVALVKNANQVHARRKQVVFPLAKRGGGSPQWMFFL
jgi:uncharacterized protein (DUF3084 family)